MGWRDEYRVHPVADFFPMLEEEEAAKLRADILENGLTSQVSFFFRSESSDPSPLSTRKPMVFWVTVATGWKH